MTRRPLRSHLLTICMIATDGVAIVLLWKAAWQVRFALDEKFGLDFINEYCGSYTHALPPFLFLWWGILAAHGHYSHHRRISSLNELKRVIQSSFILFLAMPALAWFLKEFELGRSVVLLGWGLLSVYLYISRTILRHVKQTLVRRGIGVIRVLIYGAGETGREVAESVRDHPEVGYRLVGFIDSGDAAVDGEVAGAPVLGGKADLVRIARETGADEVFLASPEMETGEMLNLVVELEEARVTVKTVSNMMGVITGEFKDEEMADFPVMNLRDGHLSPGRASLKRAMDLTIILATLPLWGPLWLCIAAYLRLTQGAPAHFAHERVGKDGKPFRLYKFRTMTVDSPKHAKAPTDQKDPRITKAGRWLRRTSLDELPQLLNVLKGDMSLVGPRPEMPFIVERYEEWQRRRLDVLPGVTGLWQVIGRKNLPLHYNLEYDFYYIRNQSLWVDLTILIRTLPAVIFGKGAF